MRVIVTQPDGPVFHFTFCNTRITSNMAALDFNVIPTQGDPGVGVPTGGTAGQVLSKVSATDYDTEWSDPSGGVTDVQINGESVVSGSVANVPVAGTSTLGVIKYSTTGSGGLALDNSTGRTNINNANGSQVRVGSEAYRPITPGNQHAAAFYGLAKAAGDSSQSSSSNPVGTYTDAAKAAIQTMLGITAIIGLVEGATASQAYSIGDLFLHDGKLYKATASIAASAAIVPGTNCTQTTIIELLGGN